MKHLKSYKLFESITSEQSDDIVSYLKEVFLDLEDIGYEISIFPVLNTKSTFPDRSVKVLGYVLNIKNMKKFLDESEIMYSLEHMMSYLDEYGLNKLKISLFDVFGGLVFGFDLKSLSELKVALSEIDCIEIRVVISNFF